jgi:hypothetical protein
MMLACHLRLFMTARSGYSRNPLTVSISATASQVSRRNDAKQNSADDQTFMFEKLNKDYGPCTTTPYWG